MTNPSNAAPETVHVAGATVNYIGDDTQAVRVIVVTLRQPLDDGLAQRIGAEIAAHARGEVSPGWPEMDNSADR